MFISPVGWVVPACWRGWNGAKMPLLRYFAFVGGALLALLFVADAVLPKQELPSFLNVASSELPLIRIHSDRKWPARVVFDTSVPTVTPVIIAQAPVAPPAAVAAIAPKSRLREAFAQLTPAESKIAAGQQAKIEPKLESKIEPTAPKAADARPQPKRKVAKARVSRPPLILVAQQPHFGLFDSTW
jgi:hypothetical protein